MIFPIGDDQVQGGAKPVFSYAFIAINIAVFLLQLNTPGELVCEYGAIPSLIGSGSAYHTLISSMFMHGGWMHLMGNMMFLWVFADNLEATMGNTKFVCFYIGGGLFASLVHIFLSLQTATSGLCCSPCSTVGAASDAMICTSGVLHSGVAICSQSIPSVGASGAIAACLGAYLVMFPKSKIKMLVIYFFRTFKIPAMYFLGFWIVQQLFSGVGSLTAKTAGASGVAWWAHIGGFAFGVCAGFVYRKKV